MHDAEGLRSGELARRSGVSTDTLRHYERVGVLPEPPRSPNGYRRYGAEAVERVRLIRGALALGFSLDELAEVLAERDRGGAPCRRVRTLAASKLASAEERLAELERLVETLRSVLGAWDDRLAAMPAGGRAGLLDELAADSRRSRTPFQPVPKRRSR